MNFRSQTAAFSVGIVYSVGHFTLVQNSRGGGEIALSGGTLCTEDTLHSYTCYVCALRVDAIFFSARLEGPPEAERTTKCERSEPPLNVNGNFISPLYNIIYIALGELRGVLYIGDFVSRRVARLYLHCGISHWADI